MFEHKRMKDLVSEKLWGRFRGKMKPNFGKWNELITIRNCGQHNGACLGIPGNMVAKHSKETRGRDNTKQNRTTSGLPGTSAVIRSISWKFLFFLLFSPFYWAGFVAQRERAQQDSKVPYKVRPTSPTPQFTYERQPQHRDHPTLIRIVRGFFNVPQNYQHSRNCETGPPVYRPYPRRLESLTNCRWNYKGSTFLLSYLKTLSVAPVGVSNSWPPASQPSAQPSEPPVSPTPISYFLSTIATGPAFHRRHRRLFPKHGTYNALYYSDLKSSFCIPTRFWWAAAEDINGKFEVPQSLEDKERMKYYFTAFLFMVIVKKSSPKNLSADMTQKRWYSRYLPMAGKRMVQEW